MTHVWGVAVAAGHFTETRHKGSFNYHAICKNIILYYTGVKK